ncbi:MAG: hypothetical protein ABI355_08170 [Solirubrobacteraceae bacterium]
MPVSATWTHNREQEPPAEDPGPDASRRRYTPIVGQRTELARYTVAEGERILYGQRINGSSASSTAPPTKAAAPTSSSAG